MHRPRPAGAAPRSPAMAVHRKTPTLADPFKLTLLIFAVIAFMYFTGEVLKPLALSVLLSFALVPAVRLLERGGLPRAAAVILAVVVAMGLLGGGGHLLGEQLTPLGRRPPRFPGENAEK